MTIPLTKYIREQQQPVVLYLLWGVMTGEIYGKVSVQSGDKCMSQRKVSEWTER
jgi:hypothetical protein